MERRAAPAPALLGLRHGDDHGRHRHRRRHLQDAADGRGHHRRSRRGCSLAWVLGGVVSLIGALCYAELATAYPHAGGDYHFLTRAFGRNTCVSSTRGRASTVINTGLDRAARVRVRRLHGRGRSRSAPIRAPFGPPARGRAAHGDQHRRPRASARTQNLLTVLEVARPAARRRRRLSWPPPVARSCARARSRQRRRSAMFGLAMVFVLLTYGGWNEAAYISAEVAGGRRAIVRRSCCRPRHHRRASTCVVNVALLHGLGFARARGQQGRRRRRDACGVRTAGRAADRAASWRSPRSPRSTRR